MCTLSSFSAVSVDVKENIIVSYFTGSALTTIKLTFFSPFPSIFGHVMADPSFCAVLFCSNENIDNELLSSALSTQALLILDQI